MTEDEERHADEVNIAFQMGAEWERKQSKARIEKMETTLIAIKAMHHDGGIDDLQERDDRTYCMVCDALEGKDE